MTYTLNVALSAELHDKQKCIERAIMITKKVLIILSGIILTIIVIGEGVRLDNLTNCLSCQVVKPDPRVATPLTNSFRNTV